jgi:hypothetical protein
MTGLPSRPGFDDMEFQIAERTNAPKPPERVQQVDRSGGFDREFSRQELGRSSGEQLNSGAEWC